MGLAYAPYPGTESSGGRIPHDWSGWQNGRRAVAVITYCGRNAAPATSYWLGLDATRRCRGMAASNDGILPPLPLRNMRRFSKAFSKNLV
jgi:hypothetical protein